MARSTARAEARDAAGRKQREGEAGRKPREDAPASHASAASPGEWLVGLVGLALILAAVGYLVYAAFSTPDSPPQLRLSVESVEPSGDGYVAVVTVDNTGPTTAAALEIEGTLIDGDGGVVETSTATIDYLPRFSQRGAGLFFTRDPGRYRIALRPLGYADP